MGVAGLRRTAQAPHSIGRSIDHRHTHSQQHLFWSERRRKRASPSRSLVCLPNNALVGRCSLPSSNQPTRNTFLNRNPFPFRPKHARARAGCMAPSHARSPDSSSFLSLPCDASCLGLTSASRRGSASASRLRRRKPSLPTLAGGRVTSVRIETGSFLRRHPPTNVESSSHCAPTNQSKSLHYTYSHDISVSKKGTIRM